MLRVVEHDPLAEPVRWPTDSPGSAEGRTGTVLAPAEVGVFEDGSPVLLRLAYRNVLVGGIVGSGKSGLLNVLLAVLTGCRDVVVWGVDLKGGMELRPWAGCLDRLATTPDQAVRLLLDARAVRDHRAATAPGRLWQPSPADPALIIVIDEFAELPEEAKELADSIARIGRAVMVNLLAATQRPTQAAMGGGAARAQMDVRVCLRVRERRDVDLILGQGMWAAGWRAETLDAPGKFLLSDPEHPHPRRARAYLLTDRDVNRNATHNADHRPTIAVPRSDKTDESATDASGAGPTPGEHRADPERLLWQALNDAPEEGASVAALIEASGKGRTWVYDRLHELAEAGQATPTARRGHWRAVHRLITGDET